MEVWKMSNIRLTVLQGSVAIISISTPRSGGGANEGSTPRLLLTNYGVWSTVVRVLSRYTSVLVLGRTLRERCETMDSAPEWSTRSEPDERPTSNRSWRGAYRIVAADQAVALAIAVCSIIALDRMFALRRTELMSMILRIDVMIG